MSPPLYDGFWLPESLRAGLLGPGTRYETAWFRRGQLTGEAEAAVGVRWPILNTWQWDTLLENLGPASRPAATGHADRWRAALSEAATTLARELSLADLAEVTGFSPAMLAFALGALQWVDPAHLVSAAQLHLDSSAASRFVPLAPLPGAVRFYPARRIGRRLSFRRQAVSLVVGFAAGNVIGSALLPVLLAQLAASAPADGSPIPAVLMKNSRREAIFTPLVLTAIAGSDPGLLANVAVMIWDYTDAGLQRRLLGRAGRSAEASTARLSSPKSEAQPEGRSRRRLVLAVADDATIAAVERFVPRGARYHRHGHKVSFTAVGREYAQGRRLSLDRLARLTALDSVFWDQYGCLSSRIHFVEGAGDEYAQALTQALRVWGQQLPRGRASLRQQHTRFDRYTALEATGQVRVLSGYDDPFLVVVDRRPPDRATLSGTVNDAVERTVFVRPVDDLMDVPNVCLAALPPGSLQSMSVAVDTARLLPFAEAAGARGITALRSAGRGAFPGLAHSWDGWLPLDFAYRRSDGYFTTIDFDDVDAALRQTLDWIDT